MNTDRNECDVCNVPLGLHDKRYWYEDSNGERWCVCADCKDEQLPQEEE